MYHQWVCSRGFWPKGDPGSPLLEHTACAMHAVVYREEPALPG